MAIDILGTVYFIDSDRTEEIIKKWTMGGISYIRTFSNVYSYKPQFLPGYLDRLFTGREWTQLVYYRKVEAIVSNGEVDTKWVKAAIDRIEWAKVENQKDISVVPMLKNVLAVRGMTLKDLSHVTGIRKKTLEEYISGDTRPRPKTIEYIADCLNVDIFTLTGSDYIGLEKLIVNEHDAEVIAKRKEEGMNASLVLKQFMKFIEDSRD